MSIKTLVSRDALLVIAGAIALSATVLVVYFYQQTQPPLVGTAIADEQAVEHFESSEREYADVSLVADQPFFVAVDGEVVYSNETAPAREAALQHCLTFAYDPTYMWQTVQCGWRGDVLYHDVFVAG